MVTIKTGWLLKRENKFICCWKTWNRKHCVLFRDGDLCVYTSSSDNSPEMKIRVLKDVKSIRGGHACDYVDLPKVQNNRSALFSITTQHNTHYFLAESQDDCQAWIDTLNQVKTVPPVMTMLPPPMPPPPEYSQNLGGAPSVGGYQPPGPGYYPNQPPVYGQPVYGQPMYGQPRYGPPMYGQAMYVSQPPQQQQQNDNSTRNALLAGGGGLIGGYMLGSMMSNAMHHDHHHDYHNNSYSGDGFDSGGGGFDSFDF